MLEVIGCGTGFGRGFAALIDIEFLFVCVDVRAVARTLHREMGFWTDSETFMEISGGHFLGIFGPRHSMGNKLPV